MSDILAKVCSGVINESCSKQGNLTNLTNISYPNIFKYRNVSVVSGDSFKMPFPYIKTVFITLCISQKFRKQSDLVKVVAIFFIISCIHRLLIVMIVVLLP